MTESPAPEPAEKPHVLVVTGMSGGGKSTAADVLEDNGYSVIDNLPPALITQAVEFNAVGEGQRRLAVVVDARGGGALEALRGVVQELAQSGISTSILFLDAEDHVIMRRYEENRRPHPLGYPTVKESLAVERTMLAQLKENADVVIDTSELNVHQLRERIVEDFISEAMHRPMRVSVRSFGFKHGSPRDADLLFDVRFLPNPHWVPELRPLRGTDSSVSDYVMASDDARQFMDQLENMVAFLIPRYEAEGKSYVSIGIGCTGGHHRSVALAEELGRRLKARDVPAVVRHRDIGR